MSAVPSYSLPKPVVLESRPGQPSVAAQRRLKIAFVADTVHSASGGGILSAEFFVNRLRRDHDVVTVAADGDRTVPSLRIPFRSLTKMRFTLARPDRAVLRSALEGADVVHLQFPFWLSYSALDVATELGIPTVAAFHVQPENVLRNAGFDVSWVRDALYRRMVRDLYNRVDAVVCPTPFAEQRLREFGLVTHSEVISNGVPPDMAGVRNRASQTSSERRELSILAVGRFAPEKRQDVIVEAIRRSKHARDIRLTLAGFGPLEEAIRESARSLPNGAEVGFLSRADLLGRYASADLFIHAGEVELEGMSVLESMSAGLPAIVADAAESAASSFVLSDAFRFAAGNVNELAARIDFLFENRDLLRVASPLYAERAREYDFDASIERLVALYRGLLPGARPSLVAA